MRVEEDDDRKDSIIQDSSRDLDGGGDGDSREGDVDGSSGGGVDGSSGGGVDGSSRGGSRNLGRGGHRKGVGVGGGCAPSRAKRGSFEQYSNTDTHS